MGKFVEYKDFAKSAIRFVKKNSGSPTAENAQNTLLIDTMEL